jgi:hypothetical protein
MKKKIILALFLTVFVVMGAFAEFGMSVGGGVFSDLSFNNGSKMETTYPSSYPDPLKNRTDTVSGGFRNMSFGAFGFFDITYAEIGGYFAYGLTTYVSETKEGTKDPVKTGPTDTGGVLQFGFSFLGKYPVDMGSVTIFPLVGFDYNIVLSADTKLRGIYNAIDLSQLGFLAGIGSDVKLGGPLFIRLEGLLHLRLPTKVAKAQKEAADLIYNATPNPKPSIKTSNTMGFGPQVKVAIGYKF